MAAPDTTTGPRTLITADAVADRLGVSKFRVYELARAEKLPHVRLGRSMRFDPNAIEAFIADGGTGYDPDTPAA